MSEAEKSGQRHYYFVAYVKNGDDKGKRFGCRLFNATASPEQIDDAFLDEIIAELKGSDTDSEVMLTAFNRL